MLNIILFWSFVCICKPLVDKINNKYSELYLSSIHSIISPILCYNVLKYKDDLNQNIEYNTNIVINVLSF